MRFLGTIVLSVLAVGVGVFILLYEVRGGKIREKEAQEAKKILHFEPDKATRVFVRTKEGAVVCERGPDGWGVVEPLKWKADEAQVTSLLSGIAGATTERVVEDSATDLSAFGLHSPQVLVSISTSAGPLDTLCLGDTAPVGSTVYARKSGDPRVYLLPSSVLTSSNKTLLSLRDKTVLGIDRDEVRRFTLRSEKGSLTAARVEGFWRLESPVRIRADEFEVNKVLNPLVSGRALDFPSETPTDLERYGLDDPQLGIDLFVGENMAQKTLLVGARKDDQSYYVRDPAKPPIYVMSSAVYHALNKEWKDLRAKKVLAFTRDDVTVIECTYPGRTLRLEREGPDTWHLIRPPDPSLVKAKADRVSQFLTDLQGLKVAQYVEGERPDPGRHGLTEPTIEIALKAGERLLTSLRAGSPRGDQVYVQEGGWDSIYLVDAKDLPKLILTAAELEEKEEPGSAKTATAGKESGSGS